RAVVRSSRRLAASAVNDAALAKARPSTSARFMRSSAKCRWRFCRRHQAGTADASAPGSQKARALAARSERRRYPAPHLPQPARYATLASERRYLARDAGVGAGKETRMSRYPALIAAAAALFAMSPALAQQDPSADYPNRPVKIIVSVPAGGGVDTV